MRASLVGIVVVGMLASACGSDSPTAPTPGVGAPLSAQIQAALVEATVDEYRAETIYQLLDGLPPDVRQVLQNNQAASLLNHLPAFERCAR